MSEEITKFTLKSLAECVEVLDRLRKPINSDARKDRKGDIPYYGANGQVGTIDEWIFDEDLVLVAEDGGFFDDPFRPISYRISGKSWVNNHAHVLRPITGIDIEWLNYAICHQDIRHLIKGATLKKLNQRDLRKILIPCPSIEDQRRIVARIKECMERVEEIEGLRAEVVAEANYLAPSLYAAIENGDKWERKKIEELIKRSRNGRSIKQDNRNANGHVLSLAAVHDVTLNMSARKPIVLPDDISAKYSISVGDVFVSRSNTRDLVGLASVANQALKRVIYPDLLIKLDPRHDLIRSRFLAYALRTPESRRQIKDRAVGTSQSMVKISGQRLKDVKVPVPPLDVQDALIERYDELHDLASGLISDLRSLNSSELRQSILRKAFAGEL